LRTHCNITADHVREAKSATLKIMIME